MKKNLFLRLCLILVVGFSAFSCRTDQFSEAETFNNGAKFQLTSKRISLDESKHKAKLLPELEKAEAKFKAFSGTNSQEKIINYGNGVSIDTESVIYIENGPNYHTYTFHITKANDPAETPVENLVLTPLPDGTYKELLVTYHLTPAEKQQAENGIPINTHGKVQITELEKGTYNNGNLQGKEITGITCGWTEEAQFTTCSDNVHSNGELPTEMGGSCHAAITSQYYTVAVYKCDWIYGEGNPFNAAGPGESIGNPVGTPGGGGGSTSGSCSENGVFTAPVDPTTSINIECENGVVTQITVPVRPDIKTPCIRIKANFANNLFKNQFDALNTQENFDKDHEVGFYEKASVVNGSTVQSFSTSVGPSCGSTTPLPTVTTGITGFGHTHNDTNCDGSQTIRVPSADDIMVFLFKMVRQSHNYYGNYTNAYYLTVTSQGSYNLSYSGSVHPNDLSFDIVKLRDEYRKIFKNITSDNSDMPQDKVEKAFAKFLKEKVKIDGLEVYKVTPTSSERLDYDPATKTMNKIPCPN